MTGIWIAAPLLLLGVVLTAVWLERFSVPIILVALGLGLVVGSDGLGVWAFDDAALANEVANAGLVFILFQGGLVTKRSVLREVAVPAGGLATFGVILTGAITFAVLHFLVGWSFERSILVGAIISSTDAAATFSVLRRYALPQHVSATIEIESAANDPMAILLTAVVVESLASGEQLSWTIIPIFLWKFIAGPIIGWVMGRAAIAAFNRLNPQDRGYYYILIIAFVPLSYGLADLAQASGMLAVFTTGLVMGNRRFVYQQGVRNFSAALSMIANIGLFLLMGLLVFPSHFDALWLDGLILFAVLTVLARPISVFFGTLGKRFTREERVFIGWAGLRGSVPIVLATYPMAAGLDGGQEVFDLVFFAVLLSISIQGSSLGVVARWLGLSKPARPDPRYVLELITMAHSDLDLMVIDLPDPEGRPGPRIRELVLPPGAILTLVTRGEDVISPTGHTRLLGWDQVTVLAHPADEEEVRAALLSPFERPIEKAELARVIDAEVSDAGLEGEGALHDHVVVVGYGKVSSILTEFMTARGQPFVVIEQDRASVEALRRRGIQAIYGNGGELPVLERAGIASAKLLLLAMTQTVDARRAIERATAVNPKLRAIAWVNHASQREALSALPRTECIQTDVEIAYAMARAMLLACGVSAMETEALIMDAHRRDHGRAALPTRVVELHVAPDSLVVGKTLSELTFPEDTLVITLSRDDTFVVPSGQTELHAGDGLLVLASMENALTLERMLASPARTDPLPEASE